jgi:hypothetical protein
LTEGAGWYAGRGAVNHSLHISHSEMLEESRARE